MKKNQKKNHKRGYLSFAFGNKELDYGKIAVCGALAIKTNLKHNHTTVVTDEGTMGWLEKSLSKEVLDAAFDNVIFVDEWFPAGKRRHHDSPWVTFTAEFNNQNRFLSYKYSPYDETILIDSDYLVMNDSLDMVWGTQENFLMNCQAVDLQGNEFGSVEDRRLSQHGIPLYWATLVYFKKGEYAEKFFKLVDYVREQYNYYQFLYGFKKGFYRNDYSFSIAAHMLSGYIPGEIKPFPEDTLKMSHQKDTIAEVKDSKEIIVISHNPREEWKNTLVNCKDMNVHIMNKRELIRVSDKFINSCMEKI